MITRVRGRLRSLQNIYKLDPEERDEKIAETVCLLSVLFLLPYCSKGHAPLILSLGGWCLATYSFLVLPVLISANYRYPVKWLRQLFAKVTEMRIVGSLLGAFGSWLWNLFQRLFEEINAMEQIFIKLPNIFTFICQLFFFIMCELAFLTRHNQEEPKKKMLSGLTALLMYSVLGYFASKMRNVYLRGVALPRGMRYGFREYSRWIAKILVEWAKAIVVIMCLKEQGIRYTPDFCFTALTLTYYISTEKVFREIIPEIVSYFNIEAFDSMEYLYVPIILHLYSILLALLVGAYLMTTPYAMFTVMVSYITLYMRIKDVTINYIRVLLIEKKVYASFKTASTNELKEFDDICAVCLNRMSRAKITPCKHFFHPQCLKQCLQTSHQCPLCKQHFLQNDQ